MPSEQKGRNKVVGGSRGINRRDKSPYLRPLVLSFAKAMEAELTKHDKEKGESWRDVPPEEFALRIVDLAQKNFTNPDNMEGEFIDIGALCAMGWYGKRFIWNK